MSKVRPVSGDIAEGEAPALSGKVSKLLRDQLSKPVYFRVAHGPDGEPVIEQVAFLRSEQVAALLGFDDRTVRGWAAAGKIPHYKPPGSTVNLFELNEILRWIQERRAGQ